MLLSAIALLTGCAGTRVAQLGTLAGQQQLVTLVISQDRAVVERECQPALAVGPIMGCQTSRVVTLADGAAARTIRIVRYTDALPSALSVEIEIHELCHAVASLQSLADPCHAANDGILQTTFKH